MLQKADKYILVLQVQYFKDLQELVLGTEYFCNHLHHYLNFAH